MRSAIPARGNETDTEPFRSRALSTYPKGNGRPGVRRKGGDRDGNEIVRAAPTRPSRRQGGVFRRGTGRGRHDASGTGRRDGLRGDRLPTGGGGGAPGTGGMHGSEDRRGVQPVLQDSRNHGGSFKAPRTDRGRFACQRGASTDQGDRDGRPLRTAHRLGTDGQAPRCVRSSEGQGLFRDMPLPGPELRSGADGREGGPREETFGTA